MRSDCVSYVAQMISWLTWMILCLTALGTAALSAVIGMAGGVILLAVMLLFLPVEIAIPIHAAVQLISNSTRVILFIRHVEWKVWALFSLPATLGILVGREIFAAVDPQYLRYIIATFILIATYLPKPKADKAWPFWPFLLAGAIAGTMGMLVGAVGPIIAPFFIHAKLLKEKMIATKAVCQATIHVLKLIAFGTLGFSFGEHGTFILALGAAVILGTYLGKRLLHHVSEPLFIRLVKIALTLIAVKLIVWG